MSVYLLLVAKSHSCVHWLGHVMILRVCNISAACMTSRLALRLMPMLLRPEEGNVDKQDGIVRLTFIHRLRFSVPEVTPHWLGLTAQENVALALCRSYSQSK